MLGWLRRILPKRQKRCCGSLTFDRTNSDLHQDVTLDGRVYSQTNTVARADCCVWDEERA